MKPLLPEKEYLTSVARKRMSAGALFFNDNGDVMIIKPSYKDHWSIPGGIVDANESPFDACTREIREEIGIDIQSLNFLCVDYMVNENDDSLHFIFDGGVLTPEQISMITLDGDEIIDYVFLPAAEAIEKLSVHGQRRISSALKARNSGAGFYLEAGLKI